MIKSHGGTAALVPPYSTINILVHRHALIVGFSWSVSLQGKARLAANGHCLRTAPCARHDRNAEPDNERMTMYWLQPSTLVGWNKRSGSTMILHTLYCYHSQTTD
ncbi:MAG: hypothetical protein L3J98_11265 [Gammaproteobacteria bacterium]|nr:hypothetical protein [Gammaproteobacteria bacterium]